MQLRDTTLRALTGIITGDDSRAPYRKGRDIETFLGRFYQSPTPLAGSYSRAQYTEHALRAVQGTDALARILVAAVHPSEFVDSPVKSDDAVAYLNEHLVHDGVELIRDGRAWKLIATGADQITVSTLGPAADPLTHEFIIEQLGKCERKLIERDNDGAITNARALLEAVFREIEHRVSGAATDTKGDLTRQYRGVQKLLHLQTDRSDIPESLRQMLSGLVSIVHGVAAARNTMSDAHAPEYRPAPHHARLVVNAAKTVADFLLASYEVQRDRGLIKPVVRP